MAWMMFGWNALSVLWLPSQPMGVNTKLLARFKAASQARRAALKSKHAGSSDHIGGEGISNIF